MSAAAAPRRRIVVIVNPHAASIDARLARIVVGALQSRYDVDAVATETPGHATGLAGAAARSGADAVVTIGGDGTVNEAANALVEHHVPLFPLPGGSQNVFAKMLGIPHDLVDAAQRLLALDDDWPVRHVDVGRVNGRAFTFSAGVGLDASVVERVDAHPARKARWRQLYYMESAAVVLARDYVVRPPRFIAEAEGRDPVRGITVLVQNSDPYTYSGTRPIRVCTDVSLESGTLSAAVLRRTPTLTAPALAARLLSPHLETTNARKITSLPAVSALTVRRADDAPFVVQVDGDALAPMDRAQFDVLPGALPVLA
ncbi:unannotated protein [freshwater metagenome]|uniref:Unannotated protein n=1 Tax=freshwater metagenome TaxID=449393 RepID=A0A6J7HUQ2_9ZZZZ|nr:hypothetical protein [Actinomycetota bacterium]